MLSKKKYIFNAGFSLSEAIVVGSILGIVSIAVINTVKERHKTKAASRYYDIINQTVSTVKNHLVDYKKSKTFLNSIKKNEVSSPLGKSVLGIVVGPSNNFLQVAVSNMGGKVSKKDIKTAISSSDHLIKDKLYISEIKLLYKRKFQGIEDSGGLSKEEHGLVFVEISFRLKTSNVYKVIKRQTSVNVVYNSLNKISRTLTPGERLAKVFEDEICSTKHGGEVVGTYKKGECRGYQKLAGKAVTNKSCKELGGTLTSSGECRHDFFEPGVTECQHGIAGFNTKGNAICAGPKSLSPPILTFIPVVNISEHYTVCAIKKNQSLKCWGNNGIGQLGIGNTTSQTSPKKVDLKEKAVYVDIGVNHACALLASGTVKCWGENDYGQLGLGHTTRKYIPQKTKLGGSLTAVSLKVGSEHACALLNNGVLKCWGLNSFGQVGIDKVSRTESTPKKVKIDKKRKIVFLEVKYGNTCIILDNSDLQCWGSNMKGKLGIGESASYKKKPMKVSLSGKVQLVSIGYHHTMCAILETGILHCWGTNGNGELGIGKTSLGNKTSPQKVDLGVGAKAVSVKNEYSTTCAILATGILKCWGENRYGEVGVGDKTAKYTPQTVNLGRGRTAKSLAMGKFFTCAILDDETLRCWGQNTYGQVGVKNKTHQDTPQTVNLGVNRKVKEVRMGQSSVCSLLDNNALKCWGQNRYGEIGIGSKKIQTSPLEVKW